MDDKIIEQLSGAIDSKLGKEASAKIADDLGIIITENANTQRLLASQKEEIAQLKKSNEALVAANGNMLKRITVQENFKPEGFEDPEPERKQYSAKDMFDEKGNFLR